MKKKFLADGRPGIVPTLYGLAYFLLVVDVFAMGFFRNAGPYHTVGLTLIVLGLVAMIQTNSNIDSVHAELIEDCLGEEGESATLTVILSNRRPEACYNLSLIPHKNFRLLEPAWIPELKGSLTVAIKIECGSRGIHALESLRLQSRGFYGLFYTWKTLRTSHKLIVYPKPQGNLPLPVDLVSGHLNSRSGEDFLGHLPYRIGASLKHIDWKAYARGQDLLLKDFSSQAEGLIQLDFAVIPGLDL